MKAINAFLVAIMCLTVYQPAMADQKGKAIVGEKARGKGCPEADIGKTASSTHKGNSHQSCTAAKNDARAKLRDQTPDACHAYITSTARCQTV